MKIPNYVLDLIVKRQRYVEKALDAAYSLQEWLNKNRGFCFYELQETQRGDYSK